LGAPKDSRIDYGCSAFKDQATLPEPPVEISLEEFLAMLRFEQRHKLAELDYYDLLKKLCSNDFSRYPTQNDP
jgi:hypothetical protein